MVNEALGKSKDQIFRKMRINDIDEQHSEPRIEEPQAAKSGDDNMREISAASLGENMPRIASSEEECHELPIGGVRADELRTASMEASNSEEQIAQSDVSDSEQRGEDMPLSAVPRLDLSLLADAMKEAEAKPKITIWNKEVSAVMRYMQMTTPRYSISNEASSLMEKAVKKAYPEIWKAIEEKETTEQEWIDLGKKRRKATILRR